MTMTTYKRQSDHAIEAIFLERWSSRAFSGEPLQGTELQSLFEAARWAPSANNAQPWRFVYALKDNPAWKDFLALLNEGNRKWAQQAGALLVLVSAKQHLRKGAPEPTPLRSHSFDSGAAWAFLALQAHAQGLVSHAIGGFDREGARALLNLGDQWNVEVAIAVGHPGKPEDLPEDLRPREVPSNRKPQHLWVFDSRFQDLS
ncbi:nitroreductase family protein [Limnobacter thiooxidans]|uniref:Nitroreductase family protein n=2 Tax=Limnobacter thiooxidans TaxID=131080 RepID=A0AA86J071_9BURK|nr:nitroreductase family protein [Limnobacter thiooxidans]